MIGAHVAHDNYCNVPNETTENVFDVFNKTVSPTLKDSKLPSIL